LTFDNVNDLLLRVGARHATAGRQRGDHLIHRLPFATVRRVMPGQISIEGFSSFLRILRGRVSRANVQNFIVVTFAATR
jgi:hypothetical protein